MSGLYASSYILITILLQKKKNSIRRSKTLPPKFTIPQYLRDVYYCITMNLKHYTIIKKVSKLTIKPTMNKKLTMALVTRPLPVKRGSQKKKTTAHYTFPRKAVTQPKWRIKK